MRYISMKNAMSEQMTQDQFRQIMTSLDALDKRVEGVETRMVLRSDVFQAGLTVQGVTFAIIVAAVVVLNDELSFSPSVQETTANGAFG